MVLSDAGIRDNIIQALLEDPATDSYEIGVDVNYRIVTLTGTVDSNLEKKEAEWIASGVEGVNEVNNQLNVNFPYSYYWWGYYSYYNLYITPPQTTSLIPDDDRIKRNIANEIWWSPFVDRDQLTITVQNGEVTLEGTVDSWREYRKAAENAWEGGAYSVNNELVVK